MITTYVKELERWQELLGEMIKKAPIWIQRICYWLKKGFRTSKIIKMGKNRKLKILPYTIEELCQRRKWYEKQLIKEKNMVLSKNLLQERKLKIENKESLWNGKRLFPYLVMQTLAYIGVKLKKPIEEMSIAILVKDTTKENIEIILELVNKVKSLSIITKKIEKFERLEKYLYEEKGIAIKLSNNKKKSLKREEIIINMDWKADEVLEYEINQKAIVVNIKETIAEIPKGFSGIIINQFEIRSNQEKMNSSFLYSHRYEAENAKEIRECEIVEKLKEDKVEIEYLIGTRGKIEEAEYCKRCRQVKGNKTFRKCIDKKRILP